MADRPTRVLVNGASGSGKTWLAAALAARTGLPHVEIDALHHGPGWVPRPEFVAEVEEFSGGPEWITEWQYASVRPMLLARCDLLVWLDLPRWRVMVQVVRRTLRRRFTRQELWNGNREGPLWRILVDEEHIIRWAWKGVPKARVRMAEVAQERPDLPVVRLRSRREVTDWLSCAGRPEPPR